MNEQQLWKAILGNLEVSISRANYLTWFKNTSIIERGENYITVSVPSLFIKNWINDKYHGFIIKALKSISPDIKEVKYQIGGTKVEESNQGTLLNKSEKTEKNTVFYQTSESVNSNHNLNKQYTFETFIIGHNNELAYAASTAVSKNPGNQYNPLFIYGGVGLGKTHLMQAVGNKLLGENPRARVLYSSSEKFTNDFIKSIQQKKVDEFKNVYRSVDMLLIDDIQFIAGKEQTQEEFFHTFNELRDKGKQIIITSDRLPKDIPAIEQRLISRFEWGMVVDISPPNLETRIAIIKTKLAKKDINLSEEIINYIAENIVSNVRELEGALNKITVFSQVGNKQISLDQVKSVLGTIINSKKKVVSIRKIAETVANFYSVTVDDLIKQSRKKEFVKPRQVAMYITRKELASSFPTIGEFFGGRDHTTVMHGVEKLEKAVAIEDPIKQELELIVEKLYV